MPGLKMGVKLTALAILIGLSTMSACALQTSEQVLVLDRQELELELGETAVLTVEDKTPNQLAWSSSNTEIAEVNLGKVKAVGPGEAIITAKAGDVSVTCRVLVVLEIVLTPESLWIGSGETARILAKPVLDGESVVWSSADTRIAIVDDSGNVTAVAAGHTEIAVSLAGERAVCPVNVYCGTVSKEQAVELVAVRRPSEPQQNILENESGLREWLICLERWRTDLLCPGNPGELYEKEAVAEIALASTLFFMEPVQPVVFRPDEIILDNSVFYEREYGYIENQAWLLLSYSKSIGIEVNDNTIITNAELEDYIGEADPGSYTITYDLYRREDGTFRLGQAVIDMNEAP